MSSKKYVLLLFLSALIICAVSIYILGETKLRSGVYQAVDRYSISNHANKETRAFTNLNSNDPPFIPAICAGCHSTPGFLDFLGEDGSQKGVVDQPTTTGTVITCIACHNPSAHSLASISFHSTVEIEPINSEGVCLICHQTRQSTVGINNILQGLGDDIVLPAQGFINPHYNFSASTQFGADAQSGYEYPDRAYVGYFFHASGVNSCTDCHDPHALSVDPKKCAVCHSNVINSEDFKNIRTQKYDFNNNSDVSEGIYSEVASLQELLLSAIQVYAQEISGIPIVYADQFPYFFIDSNVNGTADAEELTTGNRYNSWTPRLLKAAYNYQFGKKDPGGYIHNPRYVIQLLQDSISDVSMGTSLSEADLPRP